MASREEVQARLARQQSAQARPRTVGLPPPRPLPSVLAARAQAGRGGLPMPSRPASPAPKKEGPHGFLGHVADIGKDLTGAVFSAPVGLLKLGGMALDEVTQVPQTAIGLATGADDAEWRGLLPGYNAARRGLAAVETGRAMANDHAELPEWVRDESPLTSSLVESFGGTGDRLVNPTKYKQAWNDGDIANILLEDIGNVSLAAGGLGLALKGATAGSLAARVGAGLERASVLGGKVSDLPIKPFTMAGEGAAGVVGRALNNESSLIRQGLEAADRKLFTDENAILTRAAMKPTKTGEWLRGERGRLGIHLSPDGRRWWDTANLSERNANKVRATLVNDMAAVAAEIDNPVLAEVAFHQINNLGEGDLLLKNRLGLDDEATRQIHVFKDVEGNTMSSAGQQAWRAYNDGSMSPEDIAKVDRAIELIKEKTALATENFQKGDGSLTEFDDQWQGDEPVDVYVENALREAGFREGDIDALRQLRDQGMEWDELESLAPELTPILNDQMTWPAKWRPAMRQMALGASKADELGIQASIPLRPTEMMAEGMPSPGYLPGGLAEVNKKQYERNQTEPLNRGLTGIRKPGSENLRSSSEYQPASLQTFTELLGKQLTQYERNKAVLDLVRDPGTPKVGSMLDEATLSRLDDEATRRATAEFRQTGRDIAKEQRRVRGELIIDELRTRGYEVVDGNTLRPENGDFNPGKSIQLESIDENTVIVPEGVRARLQQYMKGKDANMALRAIGYGNRKFKGAVLPFRITWQLGDMISVPIMAWLGEGILPTEIFSQLRKLDTRGEGLNEHIFRNKGFTDSGLTGEAAWFMGGDQKQIHPFSLRHPFNQFQNASFKFNHAMNRAGRQAVAMAKLDRLLQKEGWSLDQIDQLPPDHPVWQEPKVQAAVEETIVRAGKTMGTFDELTPFETRVMRNLFTFWPWIRHITMLTARTAIDNPARLMWTMRLGAFAYEDQEELPDWLRGALRVPDGMVPDWLVPGDTVVPLNFLNPLADTLGDPINSPKDIGKSLSPVIKTGLAGFGIDADKGTGISRPYAERDDPWSIGRAFRDATYTGLRQFPVTREALDFAPTVTGTPIGLGPHPRWRSGQTLLDENGNPIDTKSRALAIPGLIGLPKPVNLDDALAMASTSEPRRRRRRNRG